MAMPRRAASAGPCITTGASSNEMSPESGRWIPARIFIKVDLPAPFSPTSPTISPAAIWKSTRSRASTPGNRFEIADICNKGRDMARGCENTNVENWKIALCVIGLAGLVAGCQSPSSNGSGGTRPLKLAFVTNNSSDFWTIARRGVEKADEEVADVQAEFRMTADGTAAEQQRVVDDLLTKGVDAIAISPIDPQNQTPMIDAASKRTLVFTQDSDAPNSARACYIGTDNVAAGRQAGQLIREAVPDGGAIMLFVGKLDARNAQERVQGIKEVLAGSNIT